MLQKKTLTSRVFDHMMGLIKSGAVKPGEKLPVEKVLIAELGVSRTCIREALKSLEALRLISLRPRIGAVVLEPTASALFNAELFAATVQSNKADVLIEFRKIVEVGLVSLAAEKADHTDLLAIAKSITDYDVELKEGRHPYQADIDFHMAIAHASKNPLGTMVLETISEPLLKQLDLANDVPNAAAEGLHDHLRIFGAITERNPEKARSAMRTHMENAERYWRIANAGMPSQEIVGGISPAQGKEPESK